MNFHLHSAFQQGCVASFKKNCRVQHNIVVATYGGETHSKNQDKLINLWYIFNS